MILIIIVTTSLGCDVSLSFLMKKVKDRGRMWINFLAIVNGYILILFTLTTHITTTHQQ